MLASAENFFFFALHLLYLHKNSQLDFRTKHDSSADLVLILKKAVDLWDMLFQNTVYNILCHYLYDHIF